MASKNYITKRQATVLCNYIERYAEELSLVCREDSEDNGEYDKAKNDMLAYIIGMTKGDV